MSIETLHSIRMFPDISNREAWQNVRNDSRLKFFMRDLETISSAACKEAIPELTASQYMDFLRNGDRRSYELPYFKRRAGLEALVIAECLENEGRFVPRIVDYLWAILNEPTWCVPAHVSSAPDLLPECESEFIDLFSAETSMFLAQTLLLMEPVLKQVSENLVLRIRRTLVRRAILPVEKDYSRFHWITGKNNWTPWVCSNMLNVALLALSDEPKRLKNYVGVLLSFVEKYIDRYNDDGGCDEGPSYWMLAPARMFLFLETLFQASDSKFDLFSNPKIKRMCEFIADAWINGKNFVPFADCTVQSTHFPGGLVSRYAWRVKSKKTLDFITMYRAGVPFDLDAEKTFPAHFAPDSPRIARHSGMICTLAELFWTAPTQDIPQRDDFVSWYPVLQTAYSKKRRFFVAAKGGHNGENHNHNDVGQFIIYLDDQPVIIDLGKSEYTRFTFSENRYKNWINNSLGHNVPAFNGVGQSCGREFAAENVVFQEEPNGFRLEMELARCYPADLKLKTCRRLISFDCNAGIEVVDSWEAEKTLAATLHVYSHFDLVNGLFNDKLFFRTNTPYATEKLKITDMTLAANWEGRIWKTVLAAPPACSGSMRLSFRLKR